MSKQPLAEATPGEAGAKPGYANWLGQVGPLQRASYSPPWHGQAKPGEAGAKPDQQISAQYKSKHPRAEAKPGEAGAKPGCAPLIFFVEFIKPVARPASYIYY